MKIVRAFWTIKGGFRWRIDPRFDGTTTYSAGWLRIVVQH